jgi:DtxR family Mn-dependent transcriptional regulator
MAYYMSQYELTHSEVNYLKAIYHLAATAPKKISLKKMADVLKVNPPSVLDMVRKMVEKGMVFYDKTKGISLTEKGSAAALSIVRKRALWEVVLVKHLGYGLDVVNEIAEQFEYVEGKGLEEKLDKYLGSPKQDPHGNPIPKAKG